MECCVWSGPCPVLCALRKGLRGSREIVLQQWQGTWCKCWIVVIFTVISQENNMVSVTGKRIYVFHECLLRRLGIKEVKYVELVFILSLNYCRRNSQTVCCSPDLSLFGCKWFHSKNFCQTWDASLSSSKGNLRFFLNWTYYLLHFNILFSIINTKRVWAAGKEKSDINIPFPVFAAKYEQLLYKLEFKNAIKLEVCFLQLCIAMLTS